MNNRPTRINDICKKLDLSKATVSKALNGYPSVSEETRNRVLNCARELGYATPQHSTDTTARLTRIGVSALSFSGNAEASSPYQALLMGLMDELGHSHYDTVLIPPRIIDQQTVPYDEAMKNLQLDCAFINGLKTSDPYYEQLKTTSFPTLCWDFSVDNPNVHNIFCDSTEGMRMAAEHLISLGHRRIGFICAYKEAQVCLQRLDGYILALSRNGIPYDESLVYFGDFSEASGVLGFHQLIHKNVTGLVCISDVTAIGAARAAMAMGYKIPQDISIVGYDDAALTGILPMGLTSVNQHPDLIGRIAATMLGNILHHRPVADTVLHPTLTIRGSTAKVKE